VNSARSSPSLSRTSICAQTSAATRSWISPVRDRWYDAPPDEMFERLLDPDGMSAWIRDREVVVDEVISSERIAFTWDGLGDDPPSQVEIRLEPEAGGTRLTVIERALRAEPVIPFGFQPRALARV
jgi:uncharacterized protein YndB with AHSA1/START domain